MTRWFRTVQTSADWETGSALLDQIGSGWALLRIRFSWGFYGDTPVDVDLSNTAFNAMAFGLCTTIGNGTETPPNARTNSSDVAPPTQRWVWWESRAPVVTAIDAKAGVVTWRDSGPQEPGSTKGQVLATGLGEGETLNVWASWAGAFFWEPTGSTTLWLSASILSSG